MGPSPHSAGPAAQKRVFASACFSSEENHTLPRTAALPLCHPTLASNNLFSLSSRLLWEHHASQAARPVPFRGKVGGCATKDKAIHREQQIEAQPDK